MSTREQLAKWRAVAEAAMPHIQGQSWFIYRTSTHGLTVQEPNGWIAIASDKGTIEKMRHISTFDPPTVIVLLDEVERLQAEQQQAVEHAVEQEQIRWQDRLNWIHLKYGVDGSGCDSGDPLDLTDTEVHALAVLLENAQYDLRQQADEVERLRHEKIMLRSEVDQVETRCTRCHAQAKRDGYKEGKEEQAGEVERLRAAAMRLGYWLERKNECPPGLEDVGTPCPFGGDCGQCWLAWALEQPAGDEAGGKG